MSTVDIATDIPSRVVTIHEVNFVDDSPREGTVTFTLPTGLRVPSRGIGIAAGSRTVKLVSGRGSIRMFCESGEIVDDGRYAWVIQVKKSWESCPYYIRVPAGSGPISLAAIPPIRAPQRR